MPNVFYTDERFRRDDIFDTKIFCEPNRRMIEAAGPERREVEDLLEDARRRADEEIRLVREETPGLTEEARGLPARACSISAIIWPKGMEHNPPDGGARCFHVRPKAGDAVWAVVDEDWVDLLVERWPEISGTDEAWGIAELYWSGTPRRYGPGSSDLLIDGKVVVEGECPEEAEVFRPRTPGHAGRPPGRIVLPPTIRRLRRPARWAERLREKRRRIREMEMEGGPR